MLPLLRDYFGYPDFLDGQENVLRGLASSDVLATMPTGGGKSMCYVLPALVNGRTLVVSPLIALMQDQVEALTVVGIQASFINSTIDRDEQNRRYVDFINGRVRLLYVAPERFANDRFVDGLRREGISLLAIDEAHCVSEWGHDFRPDYLSLGAVREQLGSPRTLALTATADPKVRADIVRSLGLGADAHYVSTSVDRPNLSFAVVEVTGQTKRSDWLLRYLKAHEGSSGIVYVRTRNGVDDTVEVLRAGGVAVAGYHAGMSGDQRARTQRQFMRDEVPVVVATNAFGLGVDKADIRFVVHMNMPGRVESYYQEAGRAGRDGDPAECTLVYDPADERAQQFFIDRAHPDAQVVRSLWRQMVDEGQGVGQAALSGRGAVVDEDGYASAFNAFRRSGLIDPAGRIATEDPDAPVDTSSIREHRRYVEERLRRMVEYSESGRCRRMIILNYFGEQAPDHCGRCDNCTHPSGVAKPQPDEELLDILSELRDRLAARYHRPAAEILESRSLRELAAYRPDDRGELLTIWGIGPVKVDWFGDDLTSGIREWEAAHPQEGARPTRPTTSERSIPAESPLAIKDPLYLSLKEWRLSRARRDEVPAFVVFSDKTLRGIAARRPTDLDALLSVTGVGRMKVDHYGTEVLAIVGAAE